MFKFWWKGEPVITGSFRWRVINNDLENEIKDVMKRFKPAAEFQAQFPGEERGPLVCDGCYNLALRERNQNN